MPRWLAFVIFFIVALLILGGVHYYFYRRLVVAPDLPVPYRTVVAVALIVFPFCFPLSFIISRTLDVAFARFLLYPIYIWLGVMLMLFALLLCIDLVNGVAWLGARLAGYKSLVVDPGRRLFLARLIAGAATGTVFTAAGFAVWRGLGRLVIKRVEVVLPKLPPEMDGFRIVQLTDLHMGAMRSGSWLREIVKLTNGLKPDLIAITGDLADVSAKQLNDAVTTIRDLKAPHGVFFVTGNHEYFYDLHGWLEKLRELGVRVLRNERVPIRRGDDAFDLAGVDDQEGKRLAPGHGTDVPKAMRGLDPDRAVVLMAHQPRTVEDASRYGVGLVLSGHTHGGQIWPWNYLVYLQQPYVRGLHNHKGTQIYISQGTGFWGPPMRLGSTAEITLVTLRSPARRPDRRPGPTGKREGSGPCRAGGSSRDR